MLWNAVPRTTSLGFQMSLHDCSFPPHTECDFLALDKAFPLVDTLLLAYVGGHSFRLLLGLSIFYILKLMANRNITNSLVF